MDKELFEKVARVIFDAGVKWATSTGKEGPDPTFDKAVEEAWNLFQNEA